ncbi:unnamed protein product [Euphydryas editha]|uniref:PBZ-type domain-containing protein n=1 Tax=Euphydryas editha TaxID=104508 RepID=A0AAU9UQ59_EUPED|nr:unnamed protein product [Euphydryas editha]
MNSSNKRMNNMNDNQNVKRVKKECNYGEKCYRLNPAHFREFSHPHLESILDNFKGSGEYDIPEKYSLQRNMLIDQLNIIVEKNLYEPKCKVNDGVTNSTNSKETGPSDNKNYNSSASETHIKPSRIESNKYTDTKTEKLNLSAQNKTTRTDESVTQNRNKCDNSSVSGSSKPENTMSKGVGERVRDSDYRPLVPPTKRAEDFLKVVIPRGGMAAKHAASAPYHIFYTTISDARETHRQPYSITFLEILDSSLGELKCSLQINFMVEIGWLLSQYYFAGYSAKKLTILYGDDCSDMKDINKKKPNVDAHYVNMATPFGKHHTKMMILCYEDGSMRVVVSTANLYIDDWENRTQGLWFSPRCPELPADSMPHDGESPTMFKRSLMRYLGHYHLPQLVYYLDRVKRCDFSHINVFLVSSVPGSHFDLDWGMNRVGTLLRQHCEIPASENRSWPLLAQASSLGSYGNDPKLWLTGDFLHNFTKIKNQPQMLSQPPSLKIIYPSLENVKQSHDDLLGGGCLPYSAEAHKKQPWLNGFLHQWLATCTGRNKAMPHIKSYTRISPDNKKAAFYLLTSANISKAAWGSLNKGNKALRVMSYECGVLFLPRFVINEDFFPLHENAKNRLIIPYDIPPTKYTGSMSPWVSDYLY